MVWTNVDGPTDAHTDTRPYTKLSLNNYVSLAASGLDKNPHIETDRKMDYTTTGYILQIILI